MINLKSVILQKKKDTDMTEGSILRHLIVFSVPLIIGNLFQQLYNTVDTWVVGNYVSNEAYSAVGTVGPIINMLIGLFLGLSSGTSVVIAQFFGAKRYDKVHASVHTSMTVTFILTIVFTAVGILMTPSMLHLMKTPEEVFPEAQKYLTIFFAGIVGLMVYNMGAGILRAIGDSRRPFYFLVIAAVMNIVLDLLFVIKFHMGVEGVAYATIISQAVSAILIVISLMHTDSCVRFSFRELSISWSVLKLILRVGIPAALQMAVTAFSNIIVQSYINFFGADVMSGWTTYTKIDQFLFMPMQSVALAVTTFVGQNLGKGKTERAKKGVRIALIISLVSTAVMILPLTIFAPQATGFFNSKPEVIEYGTMLLRYISPFYLLCCVYQIYTGALRGAGNSKMPMIIMLSSFVLFRQVYLFVMSRYICNEILPIAMSYPAGWILCSLIIFIYYKHTKLEDTALV